MGDGASGVDEHAELGELRRRAYGPDADIFEDAAALERLLELEDAASRTWAGAVAPTAEQASVPVGPVTPKPAPVQPARVVSDASSTPPRPPLNVAGGTPAAGSDAVSVADVDSGPAAEAVPIVHPVPSAEAEEASVASVPPGRYARSRRLWARATSTRRRRVILGTGALALVGLIGGLAGWTIAQPRVDRVLAVTNATRAIDGSNDQFLSEIYTVHGPLRGHEHYGDLRVWTADADRGSKCIIVTAADPMDFVLGVGCAPSPMSASVDVYVLPGMPDTGLQLRDHSVVRFVRSGDNVTVTVAPALGPSPAP